MNSNDTFGLLDERNIMRLIPYQSYDNFDRQSLRVWCHHNARYGLPNIELVEWLKRKIEGKKTLEIGSGHGDLAFWLEIKATDNWNQEQPDVKEYYRLLGQPTIKYPDFVEKIDALNAIKKHKPEIVIASWVTHLFDPANEKAGGNMYGVQELDIVKSGITYIFIGNLGIHRDKPILRLKHTELKFPFVKSRAADPSLDRILIWNDF